MKTIEFKTWDEFEEQVCRPLAKDGDGDMWFRGQPDSSWKLEPTIYRKGGSYKLKTYLDEIGEFYKKAKVFANLPWNLDDCDFRFERWEEFVDVTGSEKIKHCKQIIEYMAYLRHHGYPSPLLDWTLSPYVATFFAYSEDCKNVDEVAVFQYREMPTGSKFIDYESGYDLRTVDCPIETHKRHYLQQSQYAVALQNKNGHDLFVSFEDVAGRSSEEGKSLGNSQDVIVKYILPKPERKKVLKLLDLMNISYLSLFGDEQALVNTLVLQTFDLK